MRVPIYHKIIVKNFSLEELKNAFKKNQVGKVPTCIEVNSVNTEVAEQNLELIKKCLDLMGVHPRFPYPLYIICKSIKKYEDLMLVPDIKQLSLYYNKKIKRLKVREQNILNKTELRTERISNQQLSFYWNKIVNEKSKNRYLNLLTHELDAYQQVYELMNKSIEKEEE